MKDILKYSIWAGIYAVLFIPFIVANSMFFPYITGKAFTFRIIVAIILGLWLILVIKDKEFRPKFSWILGSTGILTLVLLAADLSAVAPYKALWSNYERMEGWVTIAHLFAYFLVLSSMLKTEKMWLWFLRANVFTGLVLAISSLDKAAEARFSGPLGNPIYISVYFLFIFFFTVLLWYKDVLANNSKSWLAFNKVFGNILFYIYPLIALISFYAVYRTSRGVLLGAVGGLLISAILIAIFEKEKKVIKHIAIGVIAITMSIIVLFITNKDTEFVKNNPTLSRLAEVSWNNVNGQARQYVWPMALEGFKERPVLGWGQDGFNYVFNKYYDPRMHSQEQWFDRAHNAPLDFLVAGGILGLFSYLSLFGSALYLLWFRRNSLSVTERSILSGLLAGYFFQGLFVFDNLISYIMFFTSLAYIHSRSVENQEDVKYFNQFSGFIENKDNQNYVLIPIIIALTGFGVYWINIPAISANKTLILALRSIQSGDVLGSQEMFEKALSYNSLGDSEIREQLLSLAPSVLKAEGIKEQTKNEFVQFAYDEINKQIEKVPNDARYHILTGSFLGSIGDFETALTYIDRAIELSPRKQTMHFQRIQVLVNLGRVEEAVEAARMTYELDKDYEQAKTIYDAVLKFKEASKK